jgi:hypothetical protein
MSQKTIKTLTLGDNWALGISHWSSSVSDGSSRSGGNNGEESDGLIKTIQNFIIIV